MITPMHRSQQILSSVAFLCVLTISAGAALSVPAIANAAQNPETVDPRDLQILGILYIEDNKPHEAIPLLERAADLYPENGETWMWLGVAQFFIEEFDEAEESFMKALSRNPGLTEVRNYLGLMRYKQGDTGGAIREYLEALKDPVYPPISKSRVRFNLGNVYLETGNADAALEQFAAGAASVSERDQLYQPIHLQLAQALVDLGRVQEAISALNKVINVEEQNVEAHLQLGFAYRDISQDPAARRHLQKVIELAPGTEASERAQAALARLQG